MATSRQVADNLNALAARLRGPDVLIPVAQAVRGELLQRVFVDGDTIDGALIGRYSASYAKLRQSKGRQTSKIDLNFTGALFVSIQVVQTGQRIAIAMTDPAQAQKFADLKRRYPDVFGPGKREVNEAIRAFSAELNRILR
jgi:hypothetical protein